LNAHGVRYLLIGAHAVAFHARPRATKDLDVLVDPSEENAERTLAAVRDFFGGAELAITVADLTTPEKVIQLGVWPQRIDLMTSMMSGQSFEELWRNRVRGEFGDRETQYISLADLLAGKESSDRLQDLADAEILRWAGTAQEDEADEER
jgi:hypothetical protein